MRALIPTALAAAALLTGSANASPRPCRDAQGRIVPCPKPARPAPHRCKDAAGRFTPCDHQAPPPK